MSAPTTSDPLVVTTADGTSWWRRAVTQDGRGLYAVAGVCNCPPYLMSTLATLAEHGIRGQADALPMPVGPVPRSELDQARDDVMGACLARWEEEQDNARLRLALASAQRGRRELRTRVAELETERHSTNEALDDAVKALRARQVQDVDRSADRWARFFAPVQALREDEPATDSLPAWLYRRFMPDGEGWDRLDSDQREYWEHQARAVRRAVARGGFKPVTGGA